MTNDTYSGNRHIYVGIEHIWTHLIGFHGNIPRWGTSQLEISLISSDLVCSTLGKFIVTNDTKRGKEHTILGIEHIWTHLIGFHGNVLRWGTSQLGISLISSDLVCFNIN